MQTTRNIASHIPRIVEPIPGFKDLTVCVYGKPEASSDQERREQGFFVALDGQPVARAELLETEKDAVQSFLLQKYPQHARI